MYIIVGGVFVVNMLDLVYDRILSISQSIYVIANLDSLLVTQLLEKKVGSFKRVNHFPTVMAFTM